MATLRVEGLPELERSIKRLGQLPQKFVTKAARKGAIIPLRAARARAPVDAGQLKRGLVLKGERSRVRGKKVYQVTFSSAMNDAFVKISQSGKRAYYPASQEYGFKTKNGGWIPGYSYLKGATDDNAVATEQTMIDVLTQEVDKELRSR